MFSFTNNHMAMSVSDALKQKQRISFPFTPLEVKGYFHRPMAFSDCVFDFHRLFATVDFEAILKEWVHVEAPEAPDGGGDMLDVGTSSDESASTLPGPSGAADKTKEDDGEVCNTNCEEFNKALQRLNNTLNPKNIAALKDIKKRGDAKKLSKEQILVGVGIHLIQKLSGKAATSVKRSKTKCPCDCQEQLEGNELMYIGSEDTLHGELDLISLSQGVGVTATAQLEREDEGMDSDEEEIDDSKSWKVNLEVNKAERQIIAQSITFGFTENNLHKDQSPLIPSVFIDYKQFTVFVYNPVDDTLMVSGTLYFILDESSIIKAVVPEDKYSGIFFLWIILHHRLFFKKKLALDLDKYKSKFHEQVEISHYKQLSSYKRRVHYIPVGLGLKPGICFKVKPPEKPVIGEKRRRLNTD